MPPTSLSEGRVNPGSFRDPSGFIYQKDGKLLRQINRSFSDDWSFFLDSGLYDTLVQNGQILPVSKADKSLAFDDNAVEIIEPERLSFVSYPYEWCFSQMKAGALLTLDLMQAALEKGMWLKDASNFNIQFVGTRPVHFDTLSFEKYQEGKPWAAYGQFCRHFLAPLAACAYLDSRTLQSLRIHLDGLPLDLLSKALPLRARWRPGIMMHIQMHGRASTDGSTRTTGQKVSKASLLGLLDSLRSTVNSLQSAKGPSHWTGYYGDNNYADDSAREKERLVETMLKSIQPKPTSCWDLGANTGQFSEIAAKLEIPTLAFDFDAEVVEASYKRWRSGKTLNLCPYVQDLVNPSPALGWAHQERESLTARGPADVAMALALIHHLAIANNVPLTQIADWFHDLGRWLIIEFVPKEDSQVVRMLSSRQDIFDRYKQPEFEAAFEKRFEIRERQPIAGTQRTLYLMRRKMD